MYGSCKIYFDIIANCISCLFPYILTAQDLSPSMTMNSFMELFELTEEDCCQQMSYFHLSLISMSCCGNWQLLPSHLDMKPITAEDISRDNTGEDEKRFKFFRKWKQTKGSEATYGRLISALLAIDSREDAESICKLLKSQVTEEGECI